MLSRHNVYHNGKLSNTMRLQLLFSNPEVQELCECRASAEKVLGKKAARQLRARLEDLCAVEKISELPVGLSKPAACGTLVITLHPPHKLVLEPAMNPIPTKIDGKTDWDVIEHFYVVSVN